MKRDGKSGGGAANTTDTATLILGVLETESRHGYAIAREIERRSDALVSVGEGALYPALRGLERDGFVVSEWRASETNAAPPRRVYSLTDAGRTELARRVQRWARFADAVNRILGGATNDGGLPDAHPT